MPESDLLFDSLNEQNLPILQSYADRTRTAKAASDEHDGWLDRLESTDDFDAEELTRVHGQLIALGMLKFELSNRQTGLRYRVSERGYATLQRHVVSEEPETVSMSVDVESAEESDAAPEQPTEAYPVADAA